MTATEGQTNLSYWCHQCQSNVEALTSSETEEVKCETCGSSFIELIEESYDDGPGGETEHPSQFTSELANSLTSNTSSQEAQDQSQVESEESGDSALSVTNSQPRRRNGFIVARSSTVADPNSVNRTLARGISTVVQQVLSQVRTNNQYGLSQSSPISVYVHSGASLSNLSNFAYFGGNGSTNYDQLLHELLMASPGNRGSPPASKAIVEELKRNKRKVSVEEQAQGLDCAVCKDELLVGNYVLELDCGHMFCEECILPWLKQHNTCPVCRMEMQTDDVEYEALRKQARQNNVQTQENSEASYLPAYGDNESENGSSDLSIE